MPSTMTLFKYLSVAVAAISPVLGASPTIVTRDASSLNPSGIELQPVDPPNGIAERAPLPQSNAERMKRGLGPNKPRFAHERRNIQARQSPAPCTPHDGVIKTSYPTDGVIKQGYVFKNANGYGEYTYTEDVEQALHVNFCASPDYPFEIHTINGIQSFPLLGLIKGYTSTDSSIGSGSANSLYIAGVSHTDAGAEPAQIGNAFTTATKIQETSESTVWYLDQGSFELSVQWINPDGSSPDSFSLYAPGDNILVITGDKTALQQNYYESPTVTFTFVPLSSL